MKKIIALVICLLITASAFAFDPGEKLIWGEVGFDSYKPDEDTDATTTLSLDAVVSYFLMKDISLDIGLFWESVKGPYSDNCKDDEPTQTDSNLLLGVGGSFYINHFYVNAAVLYDLLSSKYEAKSDDTSNWNAMFLNFGGGYLFPLIEHVFIDVGVSYIMGLGQYGGDWADYKIDNKVSDLSIGAGLVVHLP